MLFFTSKDIHNPTKFVSTYYLHDSNNDCISNSSTLFIFIRDNILYFYDINNYKLSKPMIAHAISCPFRLTYPAPMVITSSSSTNHVHASS